MRATTFKMVLEGLAYMMGLDPLKDLTPDLAAKYAEFVTIRTREAVEWCFWPELMKTERRAYRAKWSALTAYAIGDEVFEEDTELYFTALTANLDKKPSDNTADWEELTVFIKSVDLDPPDGEGFTPIGHVDSITRCDPRTTRNAWSVGFLLDADGLLVAKDAPAQVWVRFRIRSPQFTTREWNGSDNYAIGALRYLDSTGDCYECLAANTGHSPDAFPTEWRKQQLPTILATYVKLAGYADALRDDGQIDKALATLGDDDDPRPGSAAWEIQRVSIVEFDQQSQGGITRVQR